MATRGAKPFIVGLVMVVSLAALVLLWPRSASCELEVYGFTADAPVGVLCKNSLAAVVVGGGWYGEGFWRGLLTQGDLTSGTRVFASSSIHGLADERIIVELATLLRGNASD